MFRSSLLPIRTDLHELFTHCERQLDRAQAPDHAPFSQDERRMICYTRRNSPGSPMRSGSERRKPGPAIGLQRPSETLFIIMVHLPRHGDPWFTS